MELRDVVKTFELESKHREHLNGFLDYGWKIITVLKERVHNGQGEIDGPYYEIANYMLGADSKDTNLGKSYQKMLDDMAALHADQQKRS